MRRIAVLFLTLLLVEGTGTASPQSPPATDSEQSFARALVPSQTELRGRIATLRESNASDAETSIRELQQAISILDDADEQATAIDRMSQEVAAMPEQFAAAEKRLESIEEQDRQLETALARDADAPIKTLQARVLTAQTEIATARRQLGQARIGELRRIERASNLAESIDEARSAYLAAVERARLALEKDPSMERPSTVLAVASEARAAARRAYLRMLPEQIIATAELEALRLRVAEERNAAAERDWKAWSELLFRRLAEQSASSIAEANSAIASLGDAPAVVEEAAAQNRDLIEQANRLRSGTSRRIDRTGELFKRADTLERLLTVEMQQLILGGSRTISERLRQQIAGIGQITALDRELDQIRRDALSLYLLEVELGQKLATLQAPPREAARRVAESLEPVADPEATEAVIASLLESRRELLVRPLMAEVRQQLGAIDEQAQGVVALSDAIERLRLFLLENLLTLRTGPPLGPQEVLSLASVGKALPTNVGSVLWTAIRRSQDAHPFWWSLSALGIGTSLLLRSRARRRLVETGEQIRRIATDSFLRTVEAAGLTIFLAATLPLTVLLLGVAIKAGAGIDAFLLVLSEILVYLTPCVAVFSLVAAATIKGGLGEAHFHWNAKQTRRIRRGAFVLLALVPPLHAMAFVLLIAVGLGSTTGSESLSRLCLIGCGLTLAITIAWTFSAHHRLRGPLAKRGLLVKIAIVLAIGAPATVGVLAWMGHAFAASQVLLLLYRSAWIAIGAVLVRDLLVRWLSAASRRIARDQLERRRMEAATEVAGAPSGSDMAEAVEEPQVDLAKVNAQAYRVIQSVFVTSIAMGLSFVWSSLLPALSGLDQIVVWETMTEVAATDGAGTVNVLQPVSILDLLGAMLVVTLTVVLTRDIPGLLQLLVLPRLPVSAGVGYAVTSFTRYGIGVVGVLVAFGMIGLRWNQVQWLASAAVLGLSFGLQEIFSNFVSGVLMLVEQPVRVGDVVTVNGVTGRVTRIEIRATTITDWDRRELVIPNKSFITGQFSNWTLSDNRTRQIVEIGVAYGSDYRLVERLLFEAASGGPGIATDPAPSVILKTFADSGVVFDLRFVVDDVSTSSTTTHQVKLRVAELFSEHGVEIPFPQRDLHLRSIDPEAMKALKPA